MLHCKPVSERRHGDSRQLGSYAQLSQMQEARGVNDDTIRKLRDAASAAHRLGDTAAAVALYEKILDLFPKTSEAVEAVFYLSSIGKARRSPVIRTHSEKKEGSDSCNEITNA
jgi:hypothetical protein